MTMSCIPPCDGSHVPAIRWTLPFRFGPPVISVKPEPFAIANRGMPVKRSNWKAHPVGGLTNPCDFSRSVIVELAPAGNVPGGSTQKTAEKPELGPMLRFELC